MWAFALLLSLMPLGAIAQPRDASEAPWVGIVAPLETCLRTARPASPALPEACLGLHARPCLQRAGNQTTAGMESCYLDELRAWDSLLNRYYRERPGGARGEALVEVQRAWLRYRDQACGYIRIHYDGGSIARILEAECMMELTARRAAVLRYFRARD